MKIKVDLGPTAVILHTRKFKRGGVMGLFAQDMVEVLAAVDPNEGKQASAQQAEGAAIAAEALARASAQREAAAREKDLPDIYERPRTQPEVRLPSRHPEEIELGPMAPAAPPAPRPQPQRAAAPVPAPERVAAAAAERSVAISAERLNEARRAKLAEQARANGVILLDDDEPPTRMASPSQVTMLPDHVASEVQDLKSTVGDLKAMLVNVVSKLDNQPRTAAQFPTILQKVFDRLLALDVEPSIARGLTVYLQKEQPHLTSYEAMCDALEMPVAGLMKTAAPLKVEKGERKIVALVGPTGVGKTTTIAKLAANFALQRNVDMALLTIDTYRVAAIEQLKTYGDIIGLPVEVVLTPQTLKEALKLHNDKGMILIDTAGRSPYNRLHINELRSFMDVEPRIETHLVLSATTRLSDLKQIVKNFGPVGIDRMIFTKTDETEVVGGIISIAHETGVPVTYITTGQSVPDDIQSAESAGLAKMLIQELKA